VGRCRQAVGAYRDLYLPYRFIHPMSDLYDYAQSLVRAADERAKPNAERLPGFTDRSCPCWKRKCWTNGRSIRGWSS
jgi:hypothetical protein